jgi:hypothetical protein
MKPVRILLALALLPAVAGLAHAGAKKQSAVNVRFYPEGGAEGGEFSQKVQLLNNPGRTTYMGEIPLISEREITAYYPFQARDGSFGTYFKLDSHGTNLLAQHTMSRRGSYVLVFFNGRHVVDLAVDRPVQDGIAVIPSGLTSNDIALLDMTFPVIGKESIKPSKKKAPPKIAKQNPDPTPKPAGMPRMAPAMTRQPDGSLAPAPVNPVGQ